MLTRLHTRKVDIPGEEGAWAEIKPASYRDVELAREEGLKGITDKVAMFRGMDDLIPKTSPEELAALKKQADEDPLTGLDISVLLTRCIKAWSYDAEITRETVEDLDEPTARFLAEQAWPRRAEAGKAVS
jgi:hypothetical protein